MSAAPDDRPTADDPERSDPDRSDPGRNPAPEGAEEWVPEDDRIIGKAFRVSGLVLLGIALLITAIILIEDRPEAEEKVEEAETVLPQFREERVTIPALPFTDITASAGIGFVHENGARGEKLLPETMGSGAAFFDLEGDGDPDLLLVNAAPWPGDAPRDGATRTLALYRNDGTGEFEDITAASGLDRTIYGTGVAVGDVDGDGDPDLFIAALGENLFLRNDGGSFVDATADAGLAGEKTAWSTSAGFFDGDGDGDLDLYVCNYVKWSPEIDREIDYRLVGVGRAYGPPTHFEGAHPYYYRNDGDGTFTEDSAAAGLRIENPATGAPIQKALALVPVDLEGDGDLDLIVANDTVQNTVLVNQGDGTFLEEGARTGIAFDPNGLATGAMGIDAAPFRDGAHIGIAIGNFANEMTSLYVNESPGGPFFDESVIEGIGAVSRGMLTFGLLFLDVDLDGRLDLFQANGHLEEEITVVQPSQEYRQPAQLFWNAGVAGAATYHPVPETTVGDLARPIVGRGATAADIDLDGDPDLLITQVAGPPLLLRNDQALGGHWLRVRLQGRAPNTDAIGATVELTTGDGRVLRRTVTPTRSYLCQTELPLTFGLGDATTGSGLRVTWPDGRTTDLDAFGVDHEIVVEEPAP